MKQKFSTKWKASKQPRKQRKYLVNAPLHLRKKFVHINLSKELRKKVGKRTIQVRTGDRVKIMKGKFKKKQGKVTQVKLKTAKIYVEGIQIKKMDGSKTNVPMKPSNLQIIELTERAQQTQISQTKTQPKEKPKKKAEEKKTKEEKK